MKGAILSAMLGVQSAGASEFINLSRLKDPNKSLVIVTSFSSTSNEIKYIPLQQILSVSYNDPFQLLENLSFEDLSQAVESKKNLISTGKTSDFDNPLALLDSHLCAGLNYKDHVEESGQNDEIVFFPKKGQVHGFDSVVPMRKSLLPELIDFEVEVGVVFDRDIQSESDLMNSKAAFFLVNDISDRSLQIFHYGTEPSNPSDSFSVAKSKPAYTLASPIVSLPKDWKNFSANINFELSVNRQTRQKSSTQNMSLPLKDLLLKALQSPTSHSWALSASNSFNLDTNSKTKLLPQTKQGQFYLPRGSIFFTGTPGGTLFQKPSFLEIFTAAMGIFSLPESFKELSLKQKVKSSLIFNLHKKNIYLKTGDQITSSSDVLGPLNFSLGNHD